MNNNINHKILSNTVTNYTKKGSCLLRKELRLKISKIAQEKIFSGLIPKGAVTYDAVRVGRNFNGAEYYTDVISLKDKAGKLLKRITTSVDGETKTETAKKYIRENGYCWGEMSNGFKAIFQRIRGFRKENGRITECFDDMTSTTDKKIFTRFKRTKRPQHEIIKLEERTIGKKPKIIENVYRLWDYITENYFGMPCTLEKCPKIGDYTLIESRASSKKLAIIAKNDFLLPYLSPENRSVYRFGHAVEREKGLDDAYIYLKLRPINGYKYLKDGRLCRGNYDQFRDRITVWTKNPDGTNYSREGLVNTLGHEYGHAKWYEMSDEYDFYKTGAWDLKDCTLLKEQDIETIKKHILGEKNYKKDNKEYKKYLRNMTEIIARQEGRNTSGVFRHLRDSVEDNFQFLVDLLAHYKYMYTSECSDEFESLLKSFKDPLGFINFKDM